MYKKLSLISFKDLQFFESIIIDFVTNILFAKHLYIKKTSNTILILINKLIKYATYIAITKELNIRNFAKLL